MVSAAPRRPVTPPAEPTAAALRIARTVWTRWLLLGIVLLGWALRIREYVFDRSLWGDEITVVDDLHHSSYGALLHVLPGEQAAPIGWLWAAKLLATATGWSDQGVRIVPFVAALASVPLFAYVARRAIGSGAAPVAALVFATSPKLIYYASEAKQYSSDVALTLAAIAITFFVWDRWSRRTALLWGVAGASIVWCSQPATVVVVICGAVLAARLVRDRRSLATVLVAAVLPAATLVLDYVLQLRVQAKNPILKAYWYLGYPPKPETVGGALRWIPTGYASVAADPAGVGRPALLFVLLLAGAVVLLLRRDARWPLAVLVVPLVAAMAMAVAEVYPLRQRLALYLLGPAFALATGAVGVAGFGRGVRTRRFAVVAGVLALVLEVVTFGPSVRTGSAVFARPLDNISGRQQVEVLAREYRPGDKVYAEYLFGQAAYTYYAPRYPQLPAQIPFQIWFPTAAHPCGQASTLLDGLAPGTRVWVDFEAQSPLAPADSTQVYLSYFLAHGRLLEQHRRSRAQGELDLVLITGHGPAPQPSWNPQACFLIYD